MYPICFLFKGICLVEGESQFNSSAIGSMNWDGSKDYGLFQISEKYWCLPGVKRATGCKLKCEGRMSEKCVKDCKKAHSRTHFSHYICYFCAQI